MKRVPIIAVACLLAAVPLSCRRRQQVYPTSQPSNAAVAGKYAVAGDSEVIEQHGATGTLDLYPDGTFVMRNMPGWTGVLGQGKLWSGRGTWSIRDVGPVPSDVPRFGLTLWFDDIGGKTTNYTNHTPNLVGKAEPYDMHMYIWGSAGRALILRKIEESALPTTGQKEEEQRVQADD